MRSGVQGSCHSLRVETSVQVRGRPPRVGRRPDKLPQEGSYRCRSLIVTYISRSVWFSTVYLCLVEKLRGPNPDRCTLVPGVGGCFGRSL